MSSKEAGCGLLNGQFGPRDSLLSLPSCIFCCIRHITRISCILTAVFQLLAEMLNEAKSRRLRPRPDTGYQNYTCAIVCVWLLLGMGLVQKYSLIVAGLLLSPYVIGQAIIFLLCYFYPLLSFFSSRNLSGRRLDVYHTLTHGVALVRSEMCCLRKCRTQKSRQKSPSGHHPTTLSGYIFATKACIDNRKRTC